MTPILMKADYKVTGNTEEPEVRDIICYLNGATRCVVTEERNGEYELEMEFPSDSPQMTYLAPELILYVPHDSTKKRQPFRIYRITRMLGGKALVYARHISYDLSFVLVKKCSHSGTASMVMSAMKSNDEIVGSAYENFTFTSNVTTAATLAVNKMTTMRELLAGSSGSLLDKYGGEYEFDERAIMLKTDRGKDNGISIRYGKNMMDMKVTEDSADMWTRVMAVWTNEETEVCSYSYGVDGLNYPYSKLIRVDVSEKYDTQPTREQLNSDAQAYVRANGKKEIPLTLEVSFVDLASDPEYEGKVPMTSVCLCDTVTVFHEDFGIRTQAKVIRTVYDVLNERYESLTIGNFRKNLYDIYRTRDDGTYGSIK